MILCVVTTISYSQYQPGFLPEFFFGRQPSARAESLGKAYSSTLGDLGSVYFNAAGTATSNSIEINTSYTPPGFYSTKGFYTFLGVGSRVNKHLHLSLSQFQFNMGKTPVVNATTTPYVKRTILTISFQMRENLFLGLNTNYFIWQPGIDETSKAFYFDLGLIKTIKLNSRNTQKRAVNLGMSISNLNNAKINTTFNNISVIYHLPIVARFGASYVLNFGRKSHADSSSFVNLLTQIEYQTLLNSVYRSAIRVGQEITFSNFLSLRAGWYSEKVYDFGFPNDNKDYIAAFSYGLGVHLPLQPLLKAPVDLQFDFVSLPQPSYSKNYTMWNNFNTYGLRATYKIAK